MNLVGSVLRLPYHPQVSSKVTRPRGEIQSRHSLFLRGIHPRNLSKNKRLVADRGGDGAPPSRYLHVAVSTGGRGAVRAGFSTGC